MEHALDNMDRRVKAEQTRLLYSHRYTICWGSLFVFVIATFVLWPVSNKAHLLTWAGFATVVVLARLALSYRYFTQSVEDRSRDYKKWAHQFVAGSFLNGLIWGSVTIWFFTDEPLLFLLISCIHAGYISASSNMTAIYLPTCLTFVVTSTTLFMVGVLMHGGLDYWSYTLLLCVFAGATIMAARKNSYSISEQIELRFKNTELMKDLTIERDNAKQAMLAKNRFLAAASHDLRQPLHALGLFVDSLVPHLETPKAIGIVDKIRKSTSALGGLFHGLLDISKLDANVIENNPVSYPLSDLLSRVTQDYSDAARAKNILLEVEASCAHIVYADIALLERIIRNIMSNAIKYTSEGSVSLKCVPVGENALAITIADTGKGIPDTELDNIFSEYHQLENSERDREKGLGLGLAIVRRLGKLMDIPIEVRSEIGKGSEFTLRVPLGKHSDVVFQQSPAVASKIDDLRIVVVDDEADILDGMRNLLSGWGCEIHTGSSTMEALLALQDHDRPDLIIADFRLKAEESGLDSIQAIREEYNHDIPAVLVTGDTAPERLRQASRASAVLMHKPVKPEALRELLSELSVTAA